MKRLAGITAVLLAAAAHAMPDAIRLGGRTLPAASCGARHTLWIEHYTATLYLPSRASAAKELTDPASPKALHMEIVNKRFMPSDIPDKWRKPMERNLSPEELNRGRAAYQKLREGDRMTIAYTAEAGVSLQVNGQVMATAPGHGLIDAIVETWADGAPLAPKLGEVMARNPCQTGVAGTQRAAPRG